MRANEPHRMNKKDKMLRNNERGKRKRRPQQQRHSNRLTISRLNNSIIIFYASLKVHRRDEKSRKKDIKEGSVLIIMSQYLISSGNNNNNNATKSTPKELNGNRTRANCVFTCPISWHISGSVDSHGFSFNFINFFFEAKAPKPQWALKNLNDILT